MTLPDTLEMRIVLFGDGAKGHAVQVSRCEQHGLQCEAVRERWGRAWSETWSCDWLPNQYFPSYALLKEALERDPDIVPAAWPVVLLSAAPKDARNSGTCWNCRAKPYTTDVRAQHGWRDGDVVRVPVCDDCTEIAKRDPLMVQQRRRDWVRDHPPLKFKPLSDKEPQ